MTCDECKTYFGEEMPKGSIRINGMEIPLHPLQVVTWFLWPILNLQYFLLLMPLLWDILVVKIIVTIVFIIASLVGVIAASITCTIDPCDDVLKQPPVTIPSRTEIYCYLCEKNVLVIE
jgi:hypothetical protein